MKISAFIKNYNEGTIENLATALEVKSYLPFAEKYELCASVLDACNDVDGKTGVVTVDSRGNEGFFDRKTAMTRIVSRV